MVSPIFTLVFLASSLEMPLHTDPDVSLLGPKPSQVDVRLIACFGANLKTSNFATFPKYFVLSDLTAISPYLRRFLLLSNL